MKRSQLLAGYKFSPQRAPDKLTGQRFCRRCGGKVPKGRRTFCSDLCVHQHKMACDSAYIRQHVFERDKGVCALCGLDTAKLGRILTAALFDRYAAKYADNRSPRVHSWDKDHADLIEFFQVTCGFGARRLWQTPGDLWQADHIVPVAEGGHEATGVEHYRTLCTPCHRQVTRDLVRRLAAAKRPPPPPPAPALFEGVDRAQDDL